MPNTLWISPDAILRDRHGNIDQEIFNEGGNTSDVWKTLGILQEILQTYGGGNTSEVWK